MNALLSVSDKDGLNDFARGLDSLGVTIYATGGTERALRDAGVPVHALHELTGFTEMLDGRVKTLHPNVHAGILARRDEPRHLQELADRELKLIDLVVVNLYPFVDTVSSGAGHAEAIESIDIGGVTLLRAAAKNHDHVLPVVRPSDYPSVLAALKDRTGIPPSLRRHLAAVAFGHTAAYDAAIGEHLRDGQGTTPLPEDFTLAAANCATSATARIRTSRRRCIGRPRAAGSRRPGSGRGSSCPTTTCSMLRRPGRWLGISRRSRSPSSNTPTPAGWRSAPIRRMPSTERWPAIAGRPSAASSPSTARSMPPSPGTWSSSSSRSWSRHPSISQHSRSSRPDRNCGCCSRDPGRCSWR